MVNESMGASSVSAKTHAWEDRGSQAMGTVVASAIAAGAIAYFIRRSRTPEPAARKVVSFTRNLASVEGMEAGRDFFMDKVLPELKPALLSLVDELEEMVQQGFRRLEKAIKKL